MKVEEEELTKALLQRIFPEIEVSEKSHDQWLRAFEEKVSSTLTELKERSAASPQSDFEQQNKNLQDMVSHYKQIIDDTVSISHARATVQFDVCYVHWKFYRRVC